MEICGNRDGKHRASRSTCKANQKGHDCMVMGFSRVQIGLHWAVAALFHHFVLKDGLLDRMRKTLE